MGARPLLIGLEPSIFIPSENETWYLIHSFSSILGEAVPGSGETSFGGVGGKVYRCGLEWDGGVSELAEAAVDVLLHG